MNPPVGVTASDSSDIYKYHRLDPELVQQLVAIYRIMFPQVVARIPGGQWAEPEELAGTAIFLASSASKLITGVTIPADGGYSAS